MFLAVGAPYHTSSFGGEMKPVFVLGSTLLLPSYVYQRSNISMCSMTMFPRDPQVGVRCGLSATVFHFCGLLFLSSLCTEVSLHSLVQMSMFSLIYWNLPPPPPQSVSKGKANL